MNSELRAYLAKLRKVELKFMYSHDIDHECFGCETTMYFHLTAAIDNRMTPEQLIENIYREYPNDKHFSNIVSKINKLMTK